MRKCIFFTILMLPFLFLGHVTSAQIEHRIQGTITDAESGESLIGVNIFSEGSKIQGTTSDINGYYELTVDDSATVVFRFIGYDELRYVILEDRELDVAMPSSALDLNPVVISASRRKEKILDAPASMTLIESKMIDNKVGVNISDHIKDASGVHIMKTGIQGGTPSVRGFNGYYNSDLMSLIDNRIAQLPNYRINIFNMAPTTEEDIERIEILKGPASALYGPNTSNGVVHLITKSPIDDPETRFSVGFGLRSYIDDTILIKDPESPRFDDKGVADRAIAMFSMRHADTISTRLSGFKMGYKFSTKVFHGHDWKYDDLNDPLQVVRYIPSASGIIPLWKDGTPLTQEEIDAGETGDLVSNERDETIRKVSVDGRLDMRFRENTELIFSGGFNNQDGIDMNPIGAVQQINWRYSYFQTRFLWKDFFVQAYANFTNTGDTYFIPTGGLSIDNSKFYATQIQHSWSPVSRLQLVYGLDAFFTRPDTRYTLNGRFEDVDNINEVGVYLQGDYELLPKLTVLVATRVDYHSEIGNPFISPRAALIYKPGTGQNIRMTFNRAFKTPGPPTFFIDVRQAELPTGIGVRALGTQPGGFQFSYDNNPYFENQLLPQFRSPFSDDPSAYYHVGDQSLNNQAWQGILDVVKSEFLKEFELSGNEIVEGLVDLMISSLLPEEIDEVEHVVRDLNSTTRTFVESDWKNIQDIAQMKNTVTHNYEIGYKGILLNFLQVSLDVYKTDYQNYLAPVTFVTPGVLLNPDQLIDYVGPILSDNLSQSTNAVFNALLVRLLDKNEELGGNGNGRADDELNALIHEAVSNLPLGTITPVQASGPEMLLVSRNIGDFSVYGFEAGIGAYLSKDLKVNAHYSFVDKDSIPVPGAQFGYVALNAPRHKFVVGASYNIPSIGLHVGARFNWQAGFPASSGNFVGHVSAYHEMDLDLSWTPVFHDNLNVTLSLQNLYQNEHQFFVGSPVIGSTAMMRVSYTL